MYSDRVTVIGNAEGELWSVTMERDVEKKSSLQENAFRSNAD
jgi:hypothetical protein